MAVDLMKAFSTSNTGSVNRFSTWRAIQQGKVRETGDEAYGTPFSPGKPGFVTWRSWVSGLYRRPKWTGNISALTQIQ